MIAVWKYVDGQHEHGYLEFYEGEQLLSVSGFLKSIHAAVDYVIREGVDVNRIFIP